MSRRMKRKTSKRSAVELGRIAHELKKKGWFKDAEEKYYELLAMDSKNVYAMVGLGDLKRLKKHFAEAADYYLRCLQIDRDNWHALAGLGDAFRGMKDLDKALEVWYRCLEIRPGELKIVTRVADALRKNGDFPNARRYYSIALDRNPYDPYALMGLGVLAIEERNDEEALGHFKKHLEISEDSIIPLTSSANIYRKRKAFQKAIDLYEKVLALDPRNSHAWHGKADCLRGMERHLSAIKAWTMALENGMNPRVGLARIGDAYVSLNNLDLAEASYRKAMAVGYDKYAYLGISKIHVRKDDFDKASEVLSMLLHKEPEDPRVASETRQLIEKYPQIKRTKYLWNGVNPLA
ncbi:MAG: tetratricopeptide repeat protein [Proteobacteria bacterium]|nr:tetratricopeptide repeat protein [Pseudomonadota bacterium]